MANEFFELKCPKYLNLTSLQIWKLKNHKMPVIIKITKDSILKQKDKSNLEFFLRDVRLEYINNIIPIIISCTFLLVNQNE